VLERFTDQTRRMILSAQEEARLLQHDYVGTEHLLIAATEVDAGLTRVLAGLGLTTEAVRGAVTRMVAPAGQELRGEPPMTAEATAALERSLREALQLGHGGIRPEHVVLGLLDVHDGTMPVLLTRLGVRADAVRVAVLNQLGTVPPDAVRAPVVTVEPRCPRCDGRLEGNIRVSELQAQGERVRIASCGSCGAVVPVGWVQ
jgi:ATP-dependent Clp protease ATP-binding subunit ClpC